MLGSKARCGFPDPSPEIQVRMIGLESYSTTRYIFQRWVGHMKALASHKRLTRLTLMKHQSLVDLDLDSYYFEWTIWP